MECERDRALLASPQVGGEIELRRHTDADKDVLAADG
jgi:hypothetical protein